MEGRSTKFYDSSFSENSQSISRKNKILEVLDSYIQKFCEKFFRRDKSYYTNSFAQLIDAASRKSFISNEEQKMMKSIIKIDDVKVSDIMVPRTYIIAMPQDSTLEQIQEVVVKKEHTRMPIYKENLDEIIGFIHSKDLVKFLSHDVKEFDLTSLIRKIMYVPHSMRIMDLLRKMRSSRVHIAVVLDEYGGTDGLVTIKDIMEEIVGEIDDEHDFPENDIYNRIYKISNNLFQIGGRVEIEKIEELLEEKIIQDEDSDDFETIGGFILFKMKKIPQIGEILVLNPTLSFKILDADLRSIKLIEISRNS